MPREDRVKLNAIIACLDRAGLGPKATLEITQSPQTEWMEYLDEQELAVLSKMIMIATARMRQDTLSPDGPPALTDGQDEAR
jgi:hypothetical protein